MVLKRLRQPVRNVNAGAPGQAGVGILGTTAGNLVGAGTLVGGPSDAADDDWVWVLKRRHGGLMDPRNYGMYGQSSPRNNQFEWTKFPRFDRLHRLWVSTRCMSRF